jgi:RNA polymerase sigma-32 factor
MSLNIQPNKAFTKRAMKAELLDAETEYALAVAWRDNRDEAALHRLITAYMRLAVSMAMKFKRYSVSQQDLVQEAGVGLMKAAEKFDPDRGFRFSTYAQWWIKASMQEFVMRNWSMVRTGSTSSQKSLFFNLKRVQSKIEREAQQSGADLNRAELDALIAQEIGVPLRDVEMMQGRMSGSDFSLNAPQSTEEDTREWMDTLEDTSPQSAEVVERNNDLQTMRGWINDAMMVLNDREKYVISQRKMADDPRTLESIGDELKLSKERIRQIEAAALEKLRKRLEKDVGKAARVLVDA